MIDENIKNRKADHLDLCKDDKVAYQNKSTLLECVRLTHQSLPELNLNDIDLNINFLGKTLKAPIIISAMTGGHEKAAIINQDLASIAEKHGYGFALGSQRAMLENPSLNWTYDVRKQAPTTLILGNLGVVQARQMTTNKVEELIKNINADALAIHLNPAQELIQPEGDRDFKGNIATLERLSKELSIPLMVKETGHGMSRETLKSLQIANIKNVDVSGAGGTSWIGVETLRSKGQNKKLGELLWDWGIPTAASILYAKENNMLTMASGGLQNGYDLARALALGASVGGFARKVFMAYHRGGKEKVEDFLTNIEFQLKNIMLLTSVKTIAELQSIEPMIHGELKDWL